MYPAAIGRRPPYAGAFFWIMAFFVVYCARPEDWVPGLVYIPLAKVTGLLALGAFLVGVGHERQGLPRELVCLVLLMVQFCFTIPFASWHGGAFWRVVEFSKIVLILLVMARAVNTLERLRRLIYVQAACVATIVVVTVIKGYRVAGRLQGVLRGVYSNPNDFAFAIVLTLPLCFAFLLRTRNLFVKIVWALVMAAMIYAVVSTASRAGALALLFTMAMCLWEFGVKGRRHYLIVLAGSVTAIFLLFYGGRLKERFGAVLEPDLSSQADMAAHGSIKHRWMLLKESLIVTAEHPLVGVGPGNFKGFTGTWQVTHNSYTEMSSEAGLPALFLYLMILWFAFKNLHESKRLVGGQDEFMLFAGALHASLIGYVIGSFFASVAYSFFPYFLVAYTTALLKVSRDGAPSALDSKGARKGNGLRLGIYGNEGKARAAASF